jgi:hypothetical protein
MNIITEPARSGLLIYIVASILIGSSKFFLIVHAINCNSNKDENAPISQELLTSSIVVPDSCIIFQTPKKENKIKKGEKEN